MSVLTGKELRIVGFLCNWCSYGGADTAGVARFTQPTDLRIIRVPCSECPLSSFPDGSHRGASYWRMPSYNVQM